MNIRLLILLLMLPSLALGASKREDAEAEAAAEQARAAAAKETAAAEQARAAAAQARSQALADAYQRELAWLASEKKALERRIKEVTAQTSKLGQTGDATLAGLQGRLVETTLQADQAERTLAEVEEQALGRQDDLDRLQSALEQAEQTVGAGDREAAPADRVRRSFAGATELLGKAQSVTTAPGEFFLGDGTKTTGTLVRVGEVAAFGIAESAAGALIPVGGGRWKLHPDHGETTARALAAGTTPSPFGLFLVENPDRPLIVRADKTVSDVIEDGGTIGLVILALGAFAALLVLARFILLLGPGRSAARLLDRVEAAVRAGSVGGVYDQIGPKQGLVGELLGRVLDPDLPGRSDREEVLSEGLLAATSSYGRFGTAISVIAAVAPLLGLLGTVTGMIATFDVITTHGTGDPKMLSGGISAALVTTELGLIVAIPCLLLGSLLSARAEALVDHLERTGLEALRFVSVAEVVGQALPSASPRATSPAHAPAASMGAE